MCVCNGECSVCCKANVCGVKGEMYVCVRRMYVCEENVCCV